MPIILPVFEVTHSPGMHVLAGEAFGVQVALLTDDDGVRAKLDALLPPGWRRCSPAQARHQLVVTSPDGASFDVLHDGRSISGGSDMELALGLLDAQLRSIIALNSPDHVFVHAGAVARGERALLLPGESFAGKTSLVAALLSAGATYLSDEYAVLDGGGFVHAYPKPLSVRDARLRTTEVPAGDLGGATADRPLRVAAIVTTSYAPEAHWAPRQVSPGAGALALIRHAVAAQDEPERVMRAARAAAEGAVAFEGERGEATDAAPALLALLDR